MNEDERLDKSKFLTAYMAAVVKYAKAKSARKFNKEEREHLTDVWLYNYGGSHRGKR